MGIREATPEEIAKLSSSEASKNTPSVGGFDAIEFATGLARSIGQGLTFGTADEAEAFITSVLGDETYKQARNRIRGELETFRKDYPKTSYGSEIAASVAMPFGAAKLAGKGILKGAEQIGQKISTAAPGITKAATSTAGKAGVGGALYGAGAAEEMSDVPTSALVAGVLSAGLTKALPPVTASAKELLKKGVPLTVGQKMGGAVGGIEERLAGLPVADYLVGGARQRAVEKFGTAAYNEALAPIGAKIPKGLTGRDAYIAAEKTINKAYDDVLEGLTVPAPAALSKFADKSVTFLAADLPQREADQLARIVKREISSRIKDGALTGQAFKEAQSAIRKEAYRFNTSQDAYQRQLGDALSDVADELTGALSAANPQKAGQLANIDAAYSMFKPMQAAAGARGMEGAVTPAKLLEKVYSQSRRQQAKLARGEAPMQRFAELGREVIGTKVPDSGTAGRLLAGGALLGGGAMYDPATTGITAGTIGALYSRPGQALTRLAAPAVAAGLRAPATAGLLAQQIGPMIPQAQAGSIEDMAAGGQIAKYETVTDRQGNPVTYAMTADGRAMRVSP